MKNQPKFIAVTLQKGGLGKSAIAVNLAACLSMRKPSNYSRRRNRVLIIDGDVHATATHYLGVYNEEEKGLYDALIGSCNIDDTIKHFEYDYGLPAGLCKIDIVPSFTFLHNIEEHWKEYDNPRQLLEVAISKSKEIKKYDYVIIDCPPESDCLLSNIYNVCDYYIMPVLPDTQSDINLGITYQQIGTLSNNGRHKHYLGIVINNYMKNETADEHVKEFKRNDKVHCFETIIPHSSYYDTSILFHMPIPFFWKEYGKNTRLNRALKRFTTEVVDKINSIESEGGN